MTVELLHNTPLVVCAKAIRTCWQSQGKSDSTSSICGEADRELIHRVGNKNKHASTLEHLNYTFEIKGISRACLQELARHRHASLSVKSTRYTLKKSDISKSLVKTGNAFVDDIAQKCIETIVVASENEGISNDILKYAIPEAVTTDLVWTINARSLQNFLNLRTTRHALWEIRELAKNVIEAIPEDHKYIFEEFNHLREGENANKGEEAVQAILADRRRTYGSFKSGTQLYKQVKQFLRGSDKNMEQSEFEYSVTMMSSKVARAVNSQVSLKEHNDTILDFIGYWKLIIENCDIDQLEFIEPEEALYLQPSEIGGVFTHLIGKFVTFLNTRQVKSYDEAVKYVQGLFGGNQ